MLMTRECDYAVRILRALADGEMKSVAQICRAEDLKTAIAYKLTRKLEQAGILTSCRGAGGGYAAAKDPGELNLYEICRAMDKDLFLNDCMKEGYVCSRNPADTPCMVHKELCRIQAILVKELRRKTLKDILTAENGV